MLALPFAGGWGLGASLGIEGAGGVTEAEGDEIVGGRDVAVLLFEELRKD